LEPGRKPTKIQSQMAASLEELSAKFDDMAKQMNSFSGMAKQIEGIHEMMKQTLDSVNNMVSCQTSTEVDDLRLAHLRRHSDGFPPQHFFLHRLAGDAHRFPGRRR
jgi:sugar-specific transcriptional regulator TrmB